MNHNKMPLKNGIVFALLLTFSIFSASAYSARLPIPGRDISVWGLILQDYLGVNLDKSGGLRQGYFFPTANPDNALLGVTGLVPGQIFYRVDLAQVYLWTGSTWILMGGSSPPPVSGSCVNLSTAKCDGVTDDTVQLNADLVTYAGKEMHIIAGTCLISNSLIVPSNTHLSTCGGGTTIQAMSSFPAKPPSGCQVPMISLTGVSGVIISDLTVDGKTYAANPIRLYHSSDNRIERNQIKTDKDGSGSGCGTPSGNEWIGYGEIVLFGTSAQGGGAPSDRNVISDNQIGSSTPGSYPYVGITLEADASDNIITNNTLLNHFYWAIYAPSYDLQASLDSPSNRNLVSHNVIKTAGIGIDFRDSSYNQISNNEIYSFIVGNVFYGETAIQLQEADPSVAKARGNLISGNLIHDFYNSIGDIYILGTTDTLIEGNTVLSRNGGTGIVLGDNLSPPYIRTVRNNYFGTSDSDINFYPYNLLAAFGKSIIEGNTFNSASSDCVFISNYSSGVGEGPSRFENNTVSNCGASGILISDIGGDISVRNNFIKDVAFQPFPSAGITITGSQGQNRIFEGNVFQQVIATTNLSGWIYLSGTSAFDLIRGNINMTTSVPLFSPGFATGATAYESTPLTGGTVTPNVGTSKIIYISATSSVTVNAPTNMQAGDKVTFVVTQDGAGGRTVSWNAVFKHEWSDTGNTANKISSINFIYNGTNWLQTGKQTGYY